MTPVTVFLLSGTTSGTTSTPIMVRGMNSFTFLASAGTSDTGTGPSGTINLQASVDGVTYTTIFSTAFNNISSGVLTQADGPFYSLRASTSSLTTGNFTGVLIYSK